MRGIGGKAENPVFTIPHYEAEMVICVGSGTSATVLEYHRALRFTTEYVKLNRDTKTSIIINVTNYCFERPKSR